MGSGTSVVTISNSGNNLENPVEGKDVLGVERLLIEIAVINPGLDAVGFSTGAVLELSEIKPEASHHVTNVDDVEDETGEACKIILSLLGILFSSISIR